ncbi:MAG: rhomboid family intramembrane serine protease [Fimbriimonas sp.]
MLLPYRSKNPPESLPIVTCILLFANILTFVLTSNGVEIREDVVKAAALSANNFSARTLFTSMFLHGDIIHLLGNMWFLYLFGFSVEGRLRSFKFLPLYLLSGLAGSLLHHFIFGVQSPDIPSLGASGAIMGVLGAALFMFPYGKVDFFYWIGYFWHGTFVWPMWGVGLLYLGQDVLFALLLGGRDGVAHLAHIGGALGGFVLCTCLRPMRDSERASDARATFSESKDLSLLSSSELADLHRGNPNEAVIVLNWVTRGLRDPGGPKAEAVQAFQRLLPTIVRDEEIRSVGYCVAALSRTPGVISARWMAETASRLEREGEYQNAMHIYESILADPKAQDGDRESALFRIGMLSESAFRNFQRAQDSYQTIIQRYPMSPFASQAKARLGVVTRLAQ